MKAADLPVYYNAVDILERNLTERGDKVALYSADREMTFREVSDEVNRVGNALMGLGVRRGEYVGILAPDSAEWVTAFFGSIKIGAVGICMNTLLQSPDYDHILTDSRARVLIVHESLLPLIEPFRDQHPALENVIVIGEAQRPDDLSFHSLIENASTQLAVTPTHRDDFCALYYSSGTTGQPKGILHAHKDYPLTAQLSGVELFGLTAEDRTFSVSKLFFVYGMGGNLIFSWYVGASLVLYSGTPRMVNAVLETIERFKPTILYCVPTAYIAIMTNKKFAERYDLSSLRMCISAGESLPVSVWHAWKEKTGLEILDTIGCTENFHTFLANRPGAIRPGSSGMPSPGYAAKIVDEEGAEVSPGETGNLLVKGESMALFYLHQYEKSRQAFRGEWFFTGDKYYVDADGYYWHVGRADDMFKVGGLWVSPVAVESALSGHPSVLESAVVGQNDTLDLTRVKALVRLNEGYTPSRELTRDLSIYCTEHLATYESPRWIEFVDELPKTATGKIQRFKLRASQP